MRNVILLLTVFLGACGGGAGLKGQVVDIWGNPIEGATLKITGLTERPMTDGNGWFRMAAVSGEFTVKVGREGYIEEELSVVLGQDHPSPVVRLYPRPTEPGFFAVGSAGYVPLLPQPVKAIGNEIKTLYGVKTLGEASVDGEEIQVIYHTDLRLDQVMTLEPVIHRLTFQRDAKLHGAISTDVRVNLWVSDEALPTSLNAMKSRTDYLLKAKTSLKSGGYALTTNSLLNPPSDDAFDKIAKPLRIIFPMELR
jgi:hypothetical protein